MLIGRELMRAMQPLLKIPEWQYIVTDLEKRDSENQITYKKLLNNGYKTEERDLRIVNSTTAILLQIPPPMENYTVYILSSVTKQRFNRHLGWMLKSLKIKQDSLSEGMIIDYIRYLLLVAEDKPNSTGDKVHRWFILGWLYKFIKSGINLMRSKQALFFDWLYYTPKDSFRLYEPVWSMIINSLGKYKEMSEELLDFLFFYTKE